MMVGITPPPPRWPLRTPSWRNSNESRSTQPCKHSETPGNYVWVFHVGGSAGPGPLGVQLRWTTTFAPPLTAKRQDRVTAAWDSWHWVPKTSGEGSGGKGARGTTLRVISREAKNGHIPSAVLEFPERVGEACTQLFEPHLICIRKN